ncbi:MAG: hypothetical protein PWP65_11 [Clostridia bacterium]|nr:hypothetical protein [Clostridia bacterium]
MRNFKWVFLTAALSLVLIAQAAVRPAEASWGASKLYELLHRQPPAAQPQQPAPTPQPQPTPQPKPQPEPAPAPVGLTTQEAILFDLVNQERVKNGLRPLILHPGLTELARKKSQDMVENNYFGHKSPTYGYFYNMVYNAGIRFTSVGENLAMARDARKAFYQFLASEPHRANMLNPGFTHTGIGIVPNQYGVVVTQLFISQ